MLTAKDLSDELGISQQQVRWWARRLGLGVKRGYGAWEFSQADLDKLKNRPKPGPVRRVEK